MSLITDALKAAQQEKTQRHGEPRAAEPASSRVAYVPLRYTGAKKNRSVSPLLLGALGLAVIGVGAVFALRGGRAAQPATAPSVAVGPYVDSNASVHPDTGAPPHTTAGVDYAEAADDAPAAESPPPARAPRQPRRVATSNSVTRPGAGSFAVPLTSPRATDRSRGVSIAVERPNREASELFDDALAAQRAGDYQRARQLYGVVLERDPANADVYSNLGTVYRALGAVELAEQAFRRAISYRPRHPSAWNNLGLVLAQQNRTAEAVRALEEAIRLDPSNQAARVNLAVQYRAMGLRGDARRLLQEALAGDPNLPEAHYALAGILESEQDRNGAIRHYQLFLLTGGGRFPALEPRVRRHLQDLQAGTR